MLSEEKGCYVFHLHLYVRVCAHLDSKDRCITCLNLALWLYKLYLHVDKDILNIMHLCVKCCSKKMAL